MSPSQNGLLVPEAVQVVGQLTGRLIAVLWISLNRFADNRGQVARYIRRKLRKRYDLAALNLLNQRAAIPNWKRGTQ